MKSRSLKCLLFALFISVSLSSAFGQVPQGFNYQAIARLTTGEPIINTTLPVRITIQADSLGSSIIWQELHSSVTTNGFGLITLTLGKGARQAVSTVATFSAIDWSLTPKFIKTEISYSGWKTMGVTRFWSVPYALIAAELDGSVKKLTVNGETSLMDEALFEVRNKSGQIIFAVYSEGVRMYVSDGDVKGLKGGFAVGGFGAKASQEYLRVTSDSTRIYTNDNPAKGLKGGFAVGGFTGKAGTGNFMNLTKTNYFIGHESGSKITGGLYNSVIGYHAGMNLTSGGFNTIIGNTAGANISGGYNNIMIGDAAGFGLTTGYSNTIIGYHAGYSHTDQAYNVIIGHESGNHLNSPGWNGGFNTFLGVGSGWAIRTSRDNTFLGINAGMFLDNGQGNTFVGTDAGRAGPDPGTWVPRALTANYNTFVGNGAGYNVTSGNSNVGIGRRSGYSTTTGTGNVFIGYAAGEGETGSDKLYIANSNTSVPLLFGDFSTKMLGINTNSLTKTFNVGGDAYISGTISAINISGSLSGNLTGNVTGNLTGNVNGVEMGRIFLSEKDMIQYLLSKSMFLSYDPSVSRIVLENQNKDLACTYWYRIMNGTTSTVSSGILTFGQTVTIINDKIFNNTGFEIHFGESVAGQAYCSVWIHYYNGALMGHYMKYDK